MSQWSEPIVWKPSVSLANAATSYLGDTTVNGGETIGATAGTLRGAYAGHRIQAFINNTGQDVTVYLDYLNPTDSSWSNVYSRVCTASALTELDWLPAAADWRLRCVNGGAGPTTNSVSIVITPQRSAST